MSNEVSDDDDNREFVPGCHFSDHCYYLNDDGSCDHCKQSSGKEDIDHE
jgi:hypothetical protein